MKKSQCIAVQSLNCIAHRTGLDLVISEVTTVLGIVLVSLGEVFRSERLDSGTALSSEVCFQWSGSQVTSICHGSFLLRVRFSEVQRRLDFW